MIPYPDFLGIGPALYVTQNSDMESLDETQGAEALQILHCIQSIREKQSSAPPAIIMKIYHTLGMLYIILEDFKTALEYSIKAVNMSSKVSSSKDASILNCDLRDAVRRLSAT